MAIPTIALTTVMKKKEQYIEQIILSVRKLTRDVNFTTPEQPLFARQQHNNSTRQVNFQGQNCRELAYCQKHKTHTTKWSIVRWEQIAFEDHCQNSATHRRNCAQTSRITVSTLPRVACTDHESAPHLLEQLYGCHSLNQRIVCSKNRPIAMVECFQQFYLTYIVVSCFFLMSFHAKNTKSMALYHFSNLLHHQEVSSYTKPIPSTTTTIKLSLNRHIHHKVTSTPQNSTNNTTKV